MGEPLKPFLDGCRSGGGIDISQARMDDKEGFTIEPDRSVRIEKRLIGACHSC